MNIPARKIFHSLSAILVIPTLMLPDPQRKLFFIVIFLIVLLIDTLRLNNRGFRRLFLVFFKDILKREEFRVYSGATFLFFAVMLLNLLFSKEVAAFSLLLLTISDPLASIMGIYMKPRVRLFGDKTLWGFIGFLLGGFSISLFFHHIPWEAKIIAVITGALVELLSFGIDDNLLIPIGSAVVLQITKGG